MAFVTGQSSRIRIAIDEMLCKMDVLVRRKCYVNYTILNGTWETSAQVNQRLIFEINYRHINLEYMNCIWKIWKLIKTEI